jgi:hypothetical protein
MTSGTKVLRESLIVILFLAALCLLFFHEAFSKTFIFRDTVTFSQPKFQMLYHSYLEARIPLWNPGEFLGFPFMAEPQSAALYPLHLLTFWMDFPVAFRVLIIMHYFLSGLFMYCLLRQLRLRIPSCLFGALAFFGTGYLMSMNGSLNVLMAIPWLPAAAACFLRAMQRNSINWAGAGGMALAMTILVGSPDTTLFIAIVLFAFAFLYRATTSGASRGQSLLYLLFLLVVAGCLSAVQVLPSLELGAMSRKVAGYSFDEASRWSLHPFRLLEFMFPWFFGKIWPQNHFWGQFLLRSSQIPGSFPVNVNWALSIYPGLVVLALAAAYAFKQKNRISIVMGILFLVFILIAMGRYSPLYRLAYHVVPFFESLRYPEKYVLGIAFVMACLSGLGFETLIELKERTELKKLVLASLIVLIAFAIISLSLLALRGIIGNAIHEWLRAEGFPPFSPLIIRHTILRAVLWPSLVALACLVVFLLAYRFNLIRTWLWPAIFLIAVMDIYWTNKAALVWGQPVIYGKEPRASTAIHERAQPEGEKYRIYRDSNLAYQARADLPGNIPYLEKLRRFERDILVPNVPEPQGLEQLSG